MQIGTDGAAQKHIIPPQPACPSCVGVQNLRISRTRIRKSRLLSDELKNLIFVFIDCPVYRRVTEEQTGGRLVVFAALRVRVEFDSVWLVHGMNLQLDLPQNDN